MLKTKRCSKCGEVKPIKEFSKHKENKDKLGYWCRKCEAEYSKGYYLNNIERIKKYHRKYYQTNLYYQNNLKRIKNYNNKYYQENSGKIKKRHKEYRESNPDYCKEVKKKCKKWRENNPEYNNKWCKDRRKKDPAFRLSKNISRVIRISIHKSKDGHRWEDLVGYTLRDLVTHLESQFREGMTWDNYGDWQIDHIIPVSLWQFKSSRDREFKQCFALCNLQPLWAEENLSKGNRIKRLEEE